MPKGFVWLKKFRKKSHASVLLTSVCWLLTWCERPKNPRACSVSAPPCTSGPRKICASPQRGRWRMRGGRRGGSAERTGRSWRAWPYITCPSHSRCHYQPHCPCSCPCCGDSTVLQLASCNLKSPIFENNYVFFVSFLHVWVAATVHNRVWLQHVHFEHIYRLYIVIGMHINL